MKTINKNLFSSDSFINQDELDIVNNYEKKIEDEPQMGFSSYYRSFFNLDLIPVYKHNILNYLKTEKKLDLNNWRWETWINIITEETNKDDYFHRDQSYLTFLTYINDGFEGGELLYKYSNEDENFFEIKPKRGLTLIMNSKLLHKVNPVTIGTRYSMVTFVNPLQKQKKSLI